MAAEDFIATLHPDLAQQDMRIEQHKYDVVREAILDALRIYGAMTFSELVELVEAQLQPGFDGSIPWYCNVVNLSLENQGEIRRVSNPGPELIEIIE